MAYNSWGDISLQVSPRGEGIFLATMRGTGKVWLQSMPIRKLIRALAPYGRNARREQSSILGNLFGQ